MHVAQRGCGLQDGITAALHDTALQLRAGEVRPVHHLAGDDGGGEEDDGEAAEDVVTDEPRAGAPGEARGRSRRRRRRVEDHGAGEWISGVQPGWGSGAPAEECSCRIRGGAAGGGSTPDGAELDVDVRVVERRPTMLEGGVGVAIALPTADLGELRRL